MIINVRNATFITPERKPKKKRLGEDVREDRGDGSSLERRNIAQNYIRSQMFRILDSAGGKMSDTEQEFWKKILWEFSEKCVNFYGIMHKQPVWNH